MGLKGVNKVETTSSDYRRISFWLVRHCVYVYYGCAVFGASERRSK